MDTYTKTAQAYLMFKSADHSAELLLKYLAHIASATQFPQTDKLLKSLETTREAFSTLIALQLITQVDVCFAQEIFQLILCFSHDAYAQDDIDLSILEAVSIEAEQLTIRFYTNDAENARLLGFQEVEALQIPSLEWDLVWVDSDEKDLSDPPLEHETDSDSQDTRVVYEVNEANSYGGKNHECAS